MPKPIALLTADWHLEDQVWSDRNEIAGDAYWGLRQIVDIAIELDADVLAAGDLLDRKQNYPMAIDSLRKQLGKLAKANRKLWFIQGQHELSPSGVPWLRAVHNAPKYVHHTPFKLRGGIEAYGIDWTPRDRVHDELEEVPKGIDLLMMHQVMHELMGGIRVTEVSAPMLPDVPYLLIGDFHRTLQLDRYNSAGKPVSIYSPGSTHMRSIDEPPIKNIFILHDDLSVKKHPLRSRPYLEMTLRTDAELDQFISEIKERLQTVQKKAVAGGLPEHIAVPLLRITYSDELRNAYRRIRAAVGRSGHLFTVVEKPAPVESIEEQVLTEAAERFQSQGLLGCLPLVLEEVKDPMAFKICQRLLTAKENQENPAKVLLALREEFGVKDS